MIDNADNRYLFHGTGMYCLAVIISENQLVEGAHWGKPGEPRGPRLTESFDIASEFITYNAYYAEGGVLVLDRAKLANDFQLVSYNDAQTGEIWDNEKEIVAVTPAITNLDKYLVAVVFDPDFIEEMSANDFMETAWSEGGWPAVLSRDDEGADKMREWLLNLKEQPLINAIGDPDKLPRHGNIEVKSVGPVR